ncbi:MAG: mechanosensitive ion channel [Myxococcota bacterium]|jgi:small conductance mechanosensitive channel|nr:mechanosensitive ion channel [Myxococcota bacterium]
MSVEQLLETTQDVITSFGLKLLAAIVILLIGRWVAQQLTKVVRKLMGRAKVDEMLVRFVGSLVYAAMLTFVIVAAVGQLGVQTTSFIAVLGAAGLAVGLALQGALANFAAGVLIVLFRPYRKGDFVEVGALTGSVEEVQIFNTVLLTPDNKTVIIPNGQVASGTITNYSAKDTRRVDLSVGVAYKADLEQVRKVLTSIIEADKRILKDPVHTIGVASLADSSVQLAVRVWVKTADYWDVFFALNETIKKRFDEEGISIPFPQRDVHVYNH